MPFEYYIHQGAKRLRCGYTTGSCAALAAKAAAQMLLSDETIESVSIVTPKGLPVCVSVLDITRSENTVRCAVQKDAGDDCDVTDGALVYAAVTKTAAEIIVDGGEGVGRVTQKGLDQPIGAAAINSAPRRMIEKELCALCTQYDYKGGFSAVISVPNGAALAAKTFNPQLGICGGISILGTSGIVEPQSLQALLDSIEVEVKMHAAQGKKRLVLTPGNYGEAFLAAHPLPKEIPTVKCANFIGDTLDFAAQNGFSEVLLVGHIGKIAKLAGGIMNTHSRVADCRTELFAAHAAVCGASQSCVKKIMDAATTDACIALLDAENLRDAVLQSMAQAIQMHLNHRAAGAFATGAVLFSNAYGLLTQTNGAAALLEKWGKYAQ